MFKPALFITKSNSTIKATEISSLITVDIMDRVTDKAGLDYYTSEELAQALAFFQAVPWSFSVHSG
jgi:hypothetical protein